MFPVLYLWVQFASKANHDEIFCVFNIKSEDDCVCRISGGYDSWELDLQCLLELNS